MNWNNHPISEWKLVYRVLHGQLARHPELIDSGFLSDLQRYLQVQAQSDGVDVSDHGSWDAWLGNEPVSCAVRMAGRSSIN